MATTSCRREDCACCKAFPAPTLTTRPTPCWSVPMGGLYWSRGESSTSPTFETPTKTLSLRGNRGFIDSTLVPFEVDFSFSHRPQSSRRCAFDQWGYQFANDGTGGTGSYINIGKGVGNKQWFKKASSPRSCHGILSSQPFPARAHNGNFLIATRLACLGVLQHEVKYDGADITAEEIEPILLSSDQNFRPSDVEVGGDGALYVCRLAQRPNRPHATQHARPQPRRDAWPSLPSNL